MKYKIATIIYNFKRFTFIFLCNLLYKTFNVINHNDTVLIPYDKRPHRIVDMYDNGTADVICDLDPNPMRIRYDVYELKFKKKFFKENLRSAKFDNGFRMTGPGHFSNYKTGENLVEKI